MANVSFTRDEIILALDVLYTSDGDKLGPGSIKIKKLSELLRKLPIHPSNKRPENFRNPVGISHQIKRFSQGYSDDSKVWNVGSLFFEVDSYYQNKLEELHQVADAIRHNQQFFEEIPFGSDIESSTFPEGALLGHLHKCIEQRDGAKIDIAERCQICQFDPRVVYKPCEGLLRNHLLTPIVELDYHQKYAAGNFITVCPSCHEALHFLRPWRTTINCEDILR